MPTVCTDYQLSCEGRAAAMATSTDKRQAASGTVPVTHFYAAAYRETAYCLVVLCQSSTIGDIFSSLQILVESDLIVSVYRITGTRLRRSSVLKGYVLMCPFCEMSLIFCSINASTLPERWRSGLAMA